MMLRKDHDYEVHIRTGCVAGDMNKKVRRKRSRSNSTHSQ
jgi:hypothetical protein